MRLRSTTTWVLAALLWSVLGAPADAHWADQAVAEIKVLETAAEMVLSFPTGLVAWADNNRSGALDLAEVERHQPALERFLSERVRFTDRGRMGKLTIEPAQAELPSSLNLSASHTTLKLTFRWPEPVQAPVVRYDLFLPGVSTASCLVTIVAGGRVQNAVFTPEHREVAITLGGSLFAAASGFVLLGIRHILTGYDHVLFLLSLLMLGGGLRALFKIVTAFTVAHSITLSLAVLNIVALPARWVESIIAASIIYVAAENLWRRQSALRNRWLVTFAFGLVHGLGFASILQELNLPRAGVAVSLLSFNLGVEMGQLAIVILASLGLRLMAAWPKATLFRLWVSAGAATAGLVWFVQRAFLGS
ncbi:MAG: HupE/UreJ family protein [Armatimonadetes bacterium]|nr:HupE/UreJ family protein [Armatimonadota bacterium]